MKIDHKAMMAAKKQPAPLDFSTMVAGVLASQSRSTAATAQIHHDVARSIADSPEQALATLMQARPGWRAAAGVLGGSFHPGVAARVNANGL
jgi:hypothetical protein